MVGVVGAMVQVGFSFVKGYASSNSPSSVRSIGASTNCATIVHSISAKASKRRGIKVLMKDQLGKHFPHLTTRRVGLSW